MIKLNVASFKKKREKKERGLDFLNLDDQIGSDESSLCLVYS